ncbi:cilia- and flagella-associated protein 45 isoform 2-T2 [Odontesthes bonariensis]|uniref:cilia- and flagella-associated protein 45 isoform X2 n=1 Tax=Odontesthes bonariensis TaxID=219752 RepID=UPI003F58904D
MSRIEASARYSPSSASSRTRSLHGRYRTLAPTSRVDETLFGSPNRVNVAQPAKDSSQKKDEGENIRIITKDFIRVLRVHRRDPSKESIILPSAEFARITSTTQALCKDDREALRMASVREREERTKAADEWKRQLHEADLSRKKNQPLTDLELEARDRDQGLVERADALRMEQEVEIKKLNQLILGAQCQATRDAQIQEKTQIQAELAEEEKRMDMMMEVERRKAVERIEMLDELRKEARMKGKQHIDNQIQKHLEEKQIQYEMKEVEKMQARENQERMDLEDLKASERKKMVQQLLQGDVMRINAETMRAKERRLEEEKMADMRDMEYTKKKLEREEEYEAEQKRLKKEKELEIARLRMQQEKAKDTKAEQDEIRARRNHEMVEREWRLKQKEMAAKKARVEEMLRVDRLEQVQDKEQSRLIEAGREKAVFERELKLQQKAKAQQKEKEDKQRQGAQRHAQALRQQVKERELFAASNSKETFEEADRLVEAARQRRMRLDEIKEKKLKELRATGLSEKYCTEVERKAGWIKSSSGLKY